LKLRNFQVESSQIFVASIAMARCEYIDGRSSMVQKIMLNTYHVKTQKTVEAAIILEATTECPFNQLNKRDGSSLLLRAPIKTGKK
jgi:hypothetical protein